MPFLLGLPALIKAIGLLPALLVAFVSAKVAARVARFMLVITLFIGIFYALRVTLLTLAAESIALMPSAIYYGMQLILPDNAATCFSAILGAKAAVLIFDVKLYLLRFLEK